MTPPGMPTPLKVTMVADRHGRYHVVDPSAAAQKIAAAEAKRARKNAKRAAAAAKVGGRANEVAIVAVPSRQLADCDGRLDRGQTGKIDIVKHGGAT